MISLSLRILRRERLALMARADTRSDAASPDRAGWAEAAVPLRLFGQALRPFPFQAGLRK